MYSTPVISGITSSAAYPILNSTVNIVAQVTNATTVYLNYRYDIADKFTRVLMYDDGMHNDSLAGDNIFGSSFIMGSSRMHYYIYAENSDASIFSPQRAEHEFYTLIADAPNPGIGQVVINEFLAQNQDYNMNESGKYEDWIELYNTSTTPLNLYGVYLTDNFSNKTKFAFPPNTIIPPHGYLGIWADQGSITTSYLHCNFKLSAGGEEIMLSNYLGVVLDSITFGAQTVNNSYGRCPDGTGTFRKLVSPTFYGWNCIIGIEKNIAQELPNIYPNPASEIINIELIDKNNENTVRFYNALGQLLLSKTFSGQKTEIDVSGFSNGIYLIKINDKYHKRVEVMH
jgi:hypothetical protein